MAKNPTKGFTMGDIEEASEKSQKEMVKNAAILPQIEGPGNPDYESTDPQRWAGDDGYDDSVEKTQVSNGSVAQMASPLNAYVSTAGHFQRLQDNIAAAFTPAKGSKTKAEKEAEFKGETEKVSKNLEETTNKEFKGFKDGEYQVPSLSDMQKNQASENYFNKFGQ